jgi:hypothetical protein
MDYDNWTLVKYRRKQPSFNVLFWKWIDLWIKWKMSNSYSWIRESKLQYIKTTFVDELINLIVTHLNELIDEWSLIKNKDLLVLLYKMLPSINSNPINFSYRELSVKLNVMNLSRVTKKLPFSLMKIIASFIPEQVKPKKYYSFQKRQHVESLITVDIDFYGNYANDILGLLYQHECEAEYLDDLLNIKYETNEANLQSFKKNRSTENEIKVNSTTRKETKKFRSIKNKTRSNKNKTRLIKSTLVDSYSDVDLI